jgi:aspartokinase
MITAASAVTRLYVSNEEALVSLNRIPFDPAKITEIFEKIGAANVSIDMISQTAPVDGEVDISFTLFKKDLQKTKEMLGSFKKDMKHLQIMAMERITKIAVEGPGMETQSGIAAKVFAALAEQQVQIQSVTTSETKIALIVADEDQGKAVKAIKKTFGI